MQISKLYKKNLSDSDILKITNGKTNIIKYDQLKNVNSIDDILKNGSCIILYVHTKPGFGHWTSITKRGKTIDFFDSYGYRPDYHLFQNSKEQNHEFGTDEAYISNLLSESPYNVDYNSHKLQGKTTNTCGRWVGVRVMLKKLSNDQFAKLFLNKKLSPDELVTTATFNEFGI